MKIKIFIVSLFILGALSCDNLLQESPGSFIAPDDFFKSEAEAEAALYGVYGFQHEFNIGDAENFRHGDLGTDVGSGRVSLYRDGQLDSYEPEDGNWRVHYAAVGAANMVISRVRASESLSDDFKEGIIGEAKYLRAFFYLNLNMLWGNVPLWLDELDLDEVENLPNTPSAQVRAQIIKDLEEAVAVLPGTVSENGRATSWWAKALLARVYLFENRWQDAKDAAKDVIDNSSHALLADVQDVFDANNKFNSELIHVIPCAQDIDGAQIQSHSSPRPNDDGPAIVPILKATEGLKIVRPDGQLITDVSSRNPGGIFQGWGSFQCLKEHYDSFEEGDTRKDMWWHFIDFTDGSRYEMTGGGSCGSALKGRAGYYPLKWIMWDQPTNNGSRDIHRTRLAELYLILAEAENELNGPTVEAYEAINTIRRRAFGDEAHDLSGLSKDEFRMAVINENRRELGGEGVRRYYLWHWGYEVYREAAASVSESLPLLIENLQPHHRWWRIPIGELEKNSSLQQNPGYTGGDK